MNRVRVRSMVGWAIVLSACSSDASLVVHLGRPLERTVASSNGYEPRFIDDLGGRPSLGPRATAFVTATRLRVQGEGVTVFNADVPARVSVETMHGLVDSVEVLSSRRVVLQEAPSLVEVVRSELRAQGWRELPACAVGLSDSRVWTWCTEPWTIEAVDDDVAGGKPRSVTLALEHGASAFLHIEVRCVQEQDSAVWFATPVYRFSTQPTCINSGPSD